MTDGRPSKLTPETKKKLIDALMLGNYYNTACSVAGIDYSTFRKWMVRAEKAIADENISAEDQCFVDLFHDVKKAEEAAVNRMVALWQKQMPEDWKAIATFLERRHSDQWARKETVKQEVTGKDGGPVEIVDLNPDERRQRIAELLAQRDGTSSAEQDPSSNV